MTDRGLPPMDGSPACPFVAFDDDRDARADQPDHRHRCFAEPDPAPRALAHQEAYCLSSAFPVCPTFQVWARREAAHARPLPKGSVVVGTGAAAGDEGVGASPAGTQDAHAPAEEWTAATPPTPDVPIESTPRRNPPRDWAAPPPWATGAGAGASAAWARNPSETPQSHTPRPESQGLAGSSADRLASGESFADVMPASHPVPLSPAGRPSDLPSTAPDPELAGLVAGAAASSREGRSAADLDEQGRPAAAYPSSTRSGRRPSVSSTRAGAGREPTPERPPQRSHVQEHDGPSWERARRYEAYPQIKTRVGLGSMPGVPRFVVLGGALAVAALALFFLPAFFGVGGDDPTSPTPGPSLASPTPILTPTPVPVPTPQTYTIQTGDTLSKIAREFGVTLDALLEANKATITNPDRIKVGDEIIIPVPVPEDVESASPAP